jgi:hypothetical protein
VTEKRDGEVLEFRAEGLEVQPSVGFELWVFKDFLMRIE